MAEDESQTTYATQRVLKGQIPKNGYGFLLQVQLSPANADGYELVSEYLSELGSMLPPPNARGPPIPIKEQRHYYRQMHSKKFTALSDRFHTYLRTVMGRAITEYDRGSRLHQLELRNLTDLHVLLMGLYNKTSSLITDSQLVTQDFPQESDVAALSTKLYQLAIDQKVLWKVVKPLSEPEYQPVERDEKQSDYRDRAADSEEKRRQWVEAKTCLLCISENIVYDDPEDGGSDGEAQDAPSEMAEDPPSMVNISQQQPATTSSPPIGTQQTPSTTPPENIGAQQLTTSEHPHTEPQHIPAPLTSTQVPRLSQRFGDFKAAMETLVVALIEASQDPPSITQQYTDFRSKVKTSTARGSAAAAEQAELARLQVEYEAMKAERQAPIDVLVQNVREALDLLDVQEKSTAAEIFQKRMAGLKADGIRYPGTFQHTSSPAKQAPGQTAYSAIGGVVDATFAAAQDATNPLSEAIRDAAAAVATAAGLGSPIKRMTRAAATASLSDVQRAIRLVEARSTNMIHVAIAAATATAQREGGVVPEELQPLQPKPGPLSTDDKAERERQKQLRKQQRMEIDKQEKEMKKAKVAKRKAEDEGGSQRKSQRK